MTQPIEPGTVRILRQDGKIVGTGFLVAKDLVVTCAHVITAADAIEGDQVNLEFTTRNEKISARVLSQFWRDPQNGDVAFLRLEQAPDDISTLPLGLAEHSIPGNIFRSFGYTTAAGINGIFANGTFDGYLRDHELIQLQSQQADHGISGAPVFDEKRGVVVGMITKGHTELGRNAETTFATAAELLFEICPEIRPSEINPYRGLDAFSAETSQFFFGRENLTETLLNVLRGGCRFLAVFGASGSGKSSVIRAGLLPALKNGKLPGSQKREQIIMRPYDYQQAQIQAAKPEPVDISQYLQTDLGKECVILFIDQFEELFTVFDGNLRERFVKELVAALDNPLLILVLSMRNEFYSAFADTAESLFNYNHKVIENVPGFLKRNELLAMIEGPAEKVGLRIENGLTELILHDLTRDGEAKSSSLPLLEFALTQLWENRHDGFLTHEEYKNLGGVTGSLAIWAETAYGELHDDQERMLAESLLTSLVHPGNEELDWPDTLWRRRLAEFTDPKIQVVIKKFVDKRLIITSGKSEELSNNGRPIDTGGEMVELVHYALVREWIWLKDLVKKNREKTRILEIVEDAARAWKAAPMNPDLYIHRGGRLEDALKLQGSLSPEAKTYLAACKTNEQRLRYRIIAGVVAAVLIVMGVLAGWAVTSNKNAIEFGYQAATAVAAKADAEVQKIEAQHQATIARAGELAAEAQLLFPNSKQMTAVLLAIQSMRMFPTTEASQILLNNTLAHLVSGDEPLYPFAVSSDSHSSDGKYVVAGGYDRIVRVWDAQTGQQIASINTDDNAISVAINSKSKYVAFSVKSTVHVWDITAEKEIAKLTHDGSVSSIAFSSDGRYLASGSSDKTARVWDISTMTEIARMTHDGRVTSVAFSPDDRYVVSGSEDNTARVWDAKTGLIVTLKTFGGLIGTVKFSPDGKYVASAGCEKNSSSRGFCFQKGIASVWDTITGIEITRMVHDGLVSSLAFSPDGKHLITGSFDKTARVWDIEKGFEISRMTHDRQVLDAAFIQDGNSALSRTALSFGRVWNATTDTQIIRTNLTDKVLSMAFSPDGKYMVSGSADQIARVWNVKTGAEVSHIKHDYLVESVAYSPTGEYVASAGGDTARVWDPKTGKEIAHMTHDIQVYSVAFSPDGKYVVSGGCDQLNAANQCIRGTARVWEPKTRTEIARMTLDRRVKSVAFSPPDGKYVLSGSDDKTARLWDAATGKEVAHMDQGIWLSAIAYSPDGRYVVLGGCDQMDDSSTECKQGSARVWDIQSGQEISHIIHDGVVISVAFSPDSKYVVSGSWDNTARVWDVATGTEIVRMIHDGPVYSVAFNPKDGRTIASGSADFSARIWMWQPDDLINEACSRVTHNLTRKEWQQYIGDKLPYQAICPNLPIEAEPSPAP